MKAKDKETDDKGVVSIEEQMKAEAKIIATQILSPLEHLHAELEALKYQYQLRQNSLYVWEGIRRCIVVRTEFAPFPYWVILYLIKCLKSLINITGENASGHGAVPQLIAKALLMVHKGPHNIFMRYENQKKKRKQQKPVNDTFESQLNFLEYEYQLKQNPLYIWKAIGLCCSNAGESNPFPG